MNLKVGRVCPQRAGLRMQNGSGALGTDAPYHYWVQGHNARVCSGNSLPGWEREKKNENFACEGSSPPRDREGATVSLPLPTH